ncbi:YceD family protein [Aquisalimonas sp.]|uniref:YceD family protein n=1 Tax=Aquisalimonas sp. TaxID=1872621 RepID=UPI0025C37885|nr:YceD family protein [Aquisalimonas sp.]
MTASTAPKTVDPALLARRDRRLSISIDMDGLERLSGLLAKGGGQVAVDLHFYVDSGRRTLISGAIRAQVTLICQRCLGPVVIDLAPNVHVAVIDCEEDADHLPEALDPLVCPAGELVLAHLVEDELILALPVIARHEDDPRCPPLTPDQPGGDGAKRDNPFAVLGALKKRPGDNDLD